MKYCYANKLTPQDKIKIILSFISFLLLFISTLPLENIRYAPTVALLHIPNKSTKNS